ncbi:hypothetical protein H7X46_28285 [Pseudonocardia sp. C8]|uniref:hypothetical protein n=1 Tax=Pseudonocardia sp. C8 TaxID=2762759 RepID=UPI001642A7E1|nr:hypothetical protein [Pseudonocardia sp. C8]MBC3194957.1 hypothetical protein [Pseudonocardia sp. C8]
MTGPQQSRPSPTVRGGDDPSGTRPSPRPRHGRADEDDPAGQEGGYPDLRTLRPTERPQPRAGVTSGDLYGGAGRSARPGPDDRGGTGADAPAAPVPAQRGTPEAGRRPTTVAEAAAARFGAPDDAPTAPGTGAGAAPTPGTAPSAGSATAGAPGTGPQHDDRRRPAAGPVTVARDPATLTVLRVITYVLVSVSCLVFLAGAAYAVLTWLELRAAVGSSPLFGGGSPFGPGPVPGG